MVYKVRISATTEEEAEDISDELIDEKLVAGTFITSGQSRFHWKGEIHDEEYFNIQAYTTAGKKQELVYKVEEMHSDDAPIIELIEIKGNDKFLEWVEDSL
ncbi:MAG: divalent cation tolerance protein CutA [Candidatus Nanohalobium sp.]